MLLGVLSGLVGVLLVATGAFAAPPPPAPTITGQPANPTNQTSATFAFTGSQSGVTFQCKLDSGAFAACTSPTTYPGLAAGSHTFQVRAVAGGKTSGATSYTWSITGAPIDTTAPVVALTKVNGAVVSFPFATSAKVTSIGGTCGTAAGDLAQVALVDRRPVRHGDLLGGSLDVGDVEDQRERQLTRRRRRSRIRPATRAPLARRP